jgi:hypothetical protein
MTLASRDVQKNCSRMRVWTFNGTSAVDLKLRKISFTLSNEGCLIRHMFRDS